MGSPGGGQFFDKLIRIGLGFAFGGESEEGNIPHAARLGNSPAVTAWPVGVGQYLNCKRREISHFSTMDLRRAHGQRGAEGLDQL